MESYHPNPQARKARAMGAKQEQKPMEHEASGHAHKVEIHHPDGHENPSPGKHHVVVHHGDGGEGEHSDHETMDEAMNHAQSAMGGGETCPHCGGQMQGGKCEDCGYSEGGSEPDGDEY